MWLKCVQHPKNGIFMQNFISTTPVITNYTFTVTITANAKSKYIKVKMNANLI